MAKGTEWSCVFDLTFACSESLLCRLVGGACGDGVVTRPLHDAKRQQALGLGERPEHGFT